MKPTTEQVKRGRKPSGRKTRMVNIRMEESLREQLRAAASKNRPQRAIVEDGVRIALLME